MFKYKKFTIKFEKACQDYGYRGWGTWREISDASLLSVLLKLQKKYTFKIVSIKFVEWPGECYITIKCKKEDNYKIVVEYCEMLKGEIDGVSF